MVTRIITNSILSGIATVIALILLSIAAIALKPPPNIAERAALAQTTLERARQSGLVSTSFALSELPLPDVQDASRRKALFIAALLPAIVRENTRIKAQRASASSISVSSAHYAMLARDYGLEPDAPRTALLRRIDTVPVSLALAQGAIESAWGTSRFARDGNAFYGERTFDPDAPGLVPQDPSDESPDFKVKSFSSAALSVRSYMKTLNTHSAYAALRQQRADMRAHNTLPTGLALAPYLHGYSEIGDEYVMRIKATIRFNELGDYNEVRLATD